MKKYFFGMLLGITLLFAATGAKAQMNFWNGTSCFIKVWGGFTYDPAVCPPTNACISPTIGIAPMSWGVLPAAPCPPMLGPTANYFRVIITYSSGATFGTGFCGGAPTPHNDCAAMPRTLQIITPTFGAVF